MTAPIAYRQRLTGKATTGAAEYYFVVPSHKQSALKLDLFSFYSPTIIAVASSTFIVHVFLGGLQPPKVNQGTILLHAKYANTQGLTPPQGLNPDGTFGIVVPGGLRLAPSDDPVVIMFSDLSNTQSGLDGNIFCTLFGWEIPVQPGGTFPRPDSVEAIL